MLVIYSMRWHHQLGMFFFCNVISCWNIKHSDLKYLADVNAGIIKTMQTVDPNAVWSVSYQHRKKYCCISDVGWCKLGYFYQVFGHLIVCEVIWAKFLKYKKLNFLLSFIMNFFLIPGPSYFIGPFLRSSTTIYTFWIILWTFLYMEYVTWFWWKQLFVRYPRQCD